MALVNNDAIQMTMPGMALNSLDAGQAGSLYVQNLRFQSGRWGTRGGFGLLGSWASLPLPGRGQHETVAVQYLQQDDGRQFFCVLGTQPVNTSMLSNGAAEGVDLTGQRCWVVSVYSVQDARWQQTILTRRASQSTRPLYAVQPVRAAGGWELDSATTGAYTYSMAGYQPLPVNSPQAPAAFTQAGDRLLMCHPDIGVWVVSPGLASADQLGVDSISGRDCQSGFGESCWLFPLQIRNGVAQDLVYLTPTEVGQPQAVTQWQGHTVLVSGRSLLFSVAGDPAAYPALYVAPLLVENPIRAALSVRNGILVLTASETYLYVPTPGAPSEGQFSIISSSTGIVPSGQQAAILANETVCWVSSRGIHQYGGGSTVTDIVTAGVDNLWASTASTGPVPNPLTSFPLSGGLPPADLSSDQVNPLQELDLQQCQLSWEPRTQELYCSLPLSNRVLVFSLGRDGPSSAAWWVFETQANGTLNPPVVPVTKTTTTVRGMRVLGIPEGGPVYGVDANGTFYQLQRGGALDCSSHPSEDHQLPYSMNWRRETAIAPPSTGNIAAFYCGPAYRLPQGYRTNYQTTSGDVWETRLYCRVPDTVLSGDIITQLEVYLSLRGSDWRWLTRPSSTDLDVAFGSTFATIAGGFTQLQATTLGGVPDAQGVQGRVVWQTPGPATWPTHPDPGLQPHVWYEVCRLRIVPVGAQQGPVDRFIDQVPVANIMTNTPATYLAAAYYGSVLDRMGNQAYGSDARQQPVDWAYHTPMIGDGSTTYKLRGLWVRARRSGRALTARAANAWPYGPACWMYSTNDRDLSAREYLEPVPPVGVGIGQVVGTFPTLPDALGGVQEQVWGSSLCRWAGTLPGDQNNAPLVGTTPVQQWACTSGGRGETARWLLFGYLCGRGEYLQFADSQTLTVLARPMAPRKRRGGQ